MPDSLAEYSGDERSDRDPLAVHMTRQMHAVVPGRDDSTKTCISCRTAESTVDLMGIRKYQILTGSEIFPRREA